MDSHRGPILHLAVGTDWAASGNAYEPPSYASDGFVHCSEPHQLAAVADARFAGRDDLVVLTIEPASLDAPVVWEDLAGEGQRYPHVYGPIPRGAVTSVRPYRPGPDGRFPRPL